MKVDLSLVDKLWRETGKDYGFCEKILKKYSNNYEKAKNYILSYDDKAITKIMNNIKNILSGEVKYRLKVYSLDQDAFINISPIFLMTLILIIPKFKYILFAGLIIMIFTGYSMSIEKLCSNTKSEQKKAIIKEDIITIKQENKKVEILEDGYLYMKVK